MTRGSRKARNLFLVLGALLTIACLDVFTQSKQGIGVQVGVASRSQSVSTKRGTSSSSTEVDIIEYNVGGRTWEVDAVRRKPLIAPGETMSSRIPSGEKVVVWYYGRLPGYAWVGGRSDGVLVAAFFVAIYWAVLVAVISGRFRRRVGRS